MSSTQNMYMVEEEEEDDKMQKGAECRRSIFSSSTPDQKDQQDCPVLPKETIDSFMSSPTILPTAIQLLQPQNNKLSSITLHPVQSYLPSLKLNDFDPSNNNKLVNSLAPQILEPYPYPSSKSTSVQSVTKKTNNSQLLLIYPSQKSNEDEYGKISSEFPFTNEETERKDKFFFTERATKQTENIQKKTPDASSSLISGREGMFSNGQLNSSIAESPKNNQFAQALKEIVNKKELSDSESDNKEENMNPNNSSIEKKTRVSGVWNSLPEKRNNQSIQIDFLKNMNVMKYVKLFMVKLKSFTISSNLKELKPKHYKWIADACAFQNSRPYLQPSDLSISRQFTRSVTVNDKYRRQTSKYISNGFKLQFNTDIIVELLKQIPVFDPNSWYFIFWDMFMLLIQIIIFFVVPLNLSFEVDWNFASMDGIITQKIVSAIFLLDLLITLNRGVYLSGSVVLQRKVIIKQYLNNIFLTDVFTFLSLASINKYVQCLILIRIQYVGVITRRLDDHFQLRMRFPIQVQLASMISSIILTAHLCSCLLYLVSRLSVEIAHEPESLLTTDQFINSDWKGRYINCLYMILITMSTVGYGDITPKNNYEKLYTMVMTMISSSTFGYIVNTIGQIFLDIEQRRASFNQKKFDITTYMNARGIPKYMQIKTIKYLEYTQLQNKHSHTKGEQIIDSLPSLLAAEIKQEFFGKILKNTKLFKSNFSEQVIHKIALKMKEIQLVPGQYLFQTGQKDNKVYFLLQGVLSIYAQNKNGALLKIESISEKNCIIGQRNFFCDQIRSKWIKCEKTANLAYIELGDFKEALIHFPYEYENFCMIRDTIIFESKTADTPCASCGKFSHLFFECPLIHLKLNKLKVIFASQYSAPQERQKTDLIFRYNRSKQFQALSMMKLIQQRLRRVRIDKVLEQLKQIESMNNINPSLSNILSLNENNTPQSLLYEEIQTYQNLFGVKSDKAFLLGVPTLIFQNIPNEGNTQRDNQINQPSSESTSSSSSSSLSDSSDCKSSHISSSKQLKSNSKSHHNDSNIETIEENAHMTVSVDKYSAASSHHISSKMDNLNHMINKNIPIFPKTMQHQGEGQQDMDRQIKDENNNQQFLPNGSLLSTFSTKHDKDTFNENKRQYSIGSTKNYKEKEKEREKEKENTNNNTAFTFSNSNNPSSQINPTSGNNSIGGMNNFPITSEQLLKIFQQALSSQSNQSFLLNSLNGQNQLNPTATISHLAPPPRIGRKSVMVPLTTSNKLQSFALQNEKSKQLNNKAVPHLSLSEGHQEQNSQARKSMFGQRQSQQQIELNNNEPSEFYFYDFESPKKMVKYFVRYNMQNVILHYNKLYKLRMYSQKKSFKADVQQNQSGVSPDKVGSKIFSPRRKREKVKDRTVLLANTTMFFKRGGKQRSFLIPQKVSQEL